MGDYSFLFDEPELTSEEALASFREAMEELGLSPRALAQRMKRLGDGRKVDAILRSIQRMASGDARVSGEMQVILELLRRERRAAKRLASTTVWNETEDRRLFADVRGVRLWIAPESKGRWSIVARFGGDGYQAEFPHWRDSLIEAKIRAVLAVDEVLDQMPTLKKAVTVHRFKVWDIQIDDYRFPSVMAPIDVINRIRGAEEIDGTAIEVEEDRLDGNGMFNPKARVGGS